MKIRSRFPTFSLAAALLALSFCAGCATSSPSSSSAGFERVVPSRAQPAPIQMNTEGEYDILFSEKSGSAVAISLRAATPDYLQFFVTTFNTGDQMHRVSPSDMRLQFKGSDAQTVRIYTASSVPAQASQDAQSDAEAAAELTDQTGRLYATDKVYGGESSSAYGGSEASEEEVLLQPAALESGQRAAGFVYAPSPTAGAGQFVFKVPVGDEMHRFQYTYQ